MITRRLDVPTHPLLTGMASLADVHMAPWQRSLEGFLAPKGDISKLEINEQWSATARSSFATARKISMSGQTWQLSLVREDVTLARLVSEEDPDYCRGFLATVNGKDVIASFLDGDLYVARAYRGQKLGAELMLALAIEDGGARDGYLYTRAGLAAAKAAHRMSIQIALTLGHDVSPKVMADHPGMEMPEAGSGGVGRRW